MKRLMNLLTVLIVAVGGYYVFEKYSRLSEEAVPPPPPPKPAAAEAAATPAPAPAAQPAPAEAAAAVAATTNLPPMPAAAPEAAAQAATQATAAVSTSVLPPMPAAATVIPAPATTTITTPAAPVSTAVVQPVVIGGMSVGRQADGRIKPLREWGPMELCAGLPQQAIAGYVQARASSGLLPLQQWMSIWANRLPDPQRALLQIEYAKQVLNSRESYVSAEVEQAARQQNARTAKTLLQSIRTRNIMDTEIIELLAQVERDADGKLTTFK